MSEKVHVCGQRVNDIYKDSEDDLSVVTVGIYKKPCGK